MSDCGFINPTITPIIIMKAARTIRATGQINLSWSWSIMSR